VLQMSARSPSVSNYISLTPGRWVRQLTDTMVEHRSLAPSPLGRVGMARADRAARVAKGQRGAAIDVPRANGSPFHSTAPRLVCCNDFKDATKAATLSPTGVRGHIPVQLITTQRQPLLAPGAL
jgi:hypothetical protein